jgi:hypothetical protein
MYDKHIWEELYSRAAVGVCATYQDNPFREYKDATNKPLLIDHDAAIDPLGKCPICAGL